MDTAVWGYYLVGLRGMSYVSTIVDSLTRTTIDVSTNNFIFQKMICLKKFEIIIFSFIYYNIMI
jgi:hypothetical protein